MSSAVGGDNAPKELVAIKPEEEAAHVIFVWRLLKFVCGALDSHRFGKCAELFGLRFFACLVNIVHLPVFDSLYFWHLVQFEVPRVF